MSFIIHQGNTLKVLPTLADKSVNCVVTSPPYWNLRDYGTGKWEGGDPNCDHIYNHGAQGKSGQRADRTHTEQAVYKKACRKCGAVRVDEQIGLEETPEQFLETMIRVFRDVWRVLRDDGTIWVNMGDGYNHAPGKRKKTDKVGDKQLTNTGSNSTGSRTVIGLKPKDLIGMPWRLAFALQQDGWYLRQDIIYCKPAPMPESVRDRCTRAHEYIFMFSKQPRYYYDIEAIKEPASADSHARYARSRSGNSQYPGNQTIAKTFDHMKEKAGVNPKAKQDGHGRRHEGFNERYFGPKSEQNESFSAAVKDLVEFRNKRSWWVIPPMPTPEAHFATFPLELAETCVLAGCPKDGIVLDPFAGSGTTGLAALKHGRNFVGVELNPQYIEIAHRRAQKEYSLFL